MATNMSIWHQTGSGFLLGVVTLAAFTTGCGSTKTVIQTRTEIRTTTVTKVIEHNTPAVYVAESAGRLRLKPASIITGVSGGFIYFDKWLAYGGDTARARVRFEFNDCEPDCADGTHHFVKADVLLSPVVACRGTPIYETMTVTRSDNETELPVGWAVDLDGLCHEGAGPP